MERHDVIYVDSTWSRIVLVSCGSWQRWDRITGWNAAVAVVTWWTQWMDFMQLVPGDHFEYVWLIMNDYECHEKYIWRCPKEMGLPFSHHPAVCLGFSMLNHTASERGAPIVWKAPYGLCTYIYTSLHWPPAECQREEYQFLSEAKNNLTAAWREWGSTWQVMTSLGFW